MRKTLAVMIVMSLLLMSFAYVSYAESGTGLIAGKVVETMDSGGYTYVNLKQKDGKSVWVAFPQTKVQKGKTIACKPGMPMQNFKSKTLNRTFDVIIFSEGIAK